jgi:hypothetical protein
MYLRQSKFKKGGWTIVEILKGERWRCQNQTCQAEIQVLSSSGVQDGTNPRCSCGQIMRKPYVRPEISTGPLTREIERRFRFPASAPLGTLQACPAHQN